MPKLSYFKDPLPEVMKNSVNFKIIINKNQTGTKSIKTSPNVEKIIKKEITYDINFRTVNHQPNDIYGQNTHPEYH